MKLVVIYPDQLFLNISCLQNVHKENSIILCAETIEECTYVKHHKQKLILQLSVMRHFVAELQKKGFQVQQYTIDQQIKSISHAISKSLTSEIQEIVVTHPSEYRQLEEVKSWKKHFNVPVTVCEDDRFICSIDEFKDWAKGRKHLLMETFYRSQRTKTGLLMQNAQPAGGEWNYDKENRQTLKELPDDYKKPRGFEPDSITQKAIKTVEKYFANHFGESEPFKYAVTRAQALEAVNHFAKHHLKNFGDYQDAMLVEDGFLYHSILSPYINIGLISPMEVCQKVEKAYHDGLAPLNAVEGFMRQIIGWREYVRGIYWLNMPGYTKRNHLQANNKLPWFYWAPEETDLNCMRTVLSQTKKTAYSHHIQRLMITGNFALLTGIAPEEVHEWYLIVYADAYEWVEAPNTIGMALYADGGAMSTKPYAASANYINKMSNFCKNCQYNPKVKTGENACPFNYLYWHFLHRHQKKLSQNHRMKFALKNLERKTPKELQEIERESQAFFKKHCMI